MGVRRVNRAEALRKRQALNEVLESDAENLAPEDPAPAEDPATPSQPVPAPENPPEEVTLAEVASSGAEPEVEDDTSGDNDDPVGPDG